MVDKELLNKVLIALFIIALIVSPVSYAVF